MKVCVVSKWGLLDGGWMWVLCGIFSNLIQAQEYIDRRLKHYNRRSAGTVTYFTPSSIHKYKLEIIEIDHIQV